MSPLRRRCWCGAESASALFSARSVEGHTFHYIQCDRCGVVIQHPMVAEEKLPQYYAPEYYGSGNKKFIGPVARFVSFFQEGRARLLSRLLTRRARVLDVGCGDGGFLEQLRARGFQTEGTEWTPESAKRAARGSDAPIHAGDLLELNLPMESYHCVTLWHVFEHLREPAAALERILELLKTGGYLVMSMPNQESWQAKALGPAWFHLDPPRHLYGFGPRSISRLLRKKGFRIRTIHSWSFEQNPYGMIQGVLNAAGFPRERAYSVLKGTADVSFSIKVIDAALVAGLTAPALALSLIESAAGKGGTFTVIAQKSN